MKKHLVLTLLLSIAVTFSHAFDFPSHTWADFQGTLGKARIQLSLFRFDNGQIKGNYCYIKNEDKIQLAGRVTGNQIELTELVNNKPSGNFKGTLLTDGQERFDGVRTDSAQTGSFTFKLILESMGRGSYAKRYSELEGTDDEVENFIKRVRTSILSGDREWIARHVSYPLKTTLNGYKTIMLKNKRQLVANFDRIFYRGFKDRVGSSCACNMFNNEYGAMLGRGEIWICDEPRPPAGKSGYTIIALNNKPPVAARRFKNPKKGSRHFYKKARH